MRIGLETKNISRLEKHRWADPAAGSWIVLALLSLVPLQLWLQAALPLFTFIWLLVPLITLIVTRSAAGVGMRPISGSLFVKYGAINFLFLMLVMAVFEPWSHTYRSLLGMVFASSQPDLTFAWVTRFPGFAGLAGMFLFSGLVTLFGEELFFRGWLLQILLKKMEPLPAIFLQAFLFTVPQAIAALLMPPLQSVLYIVVYSWFAIGVIGGWAAWKTNSIWPSLASAALMNLVLTVFLN